MNGQLRDAALEAARSFTKAEVPRIEPVGVGASNAVFYVTTAAGHELVVRAATRPQERFEVERLVMEWASEHGVPAPTVHDVATVSDVAVMITDRLPGHRLADHKTADYRHLAAQCGEILAALHSIPTEGFGNLRADGSGARATFDNWFLDDLVALAEDASSVCEPEDQQRLDRVVARLGDARSALSDLRPHLTHGDFSTMNLLVDGGCVTGVVDWESAKSGPAALDFGWWDWFSLRHGTPFTADDMLPSYRRLREVDADVLAELRQLVVLRVTIGHLAWAAERGDRSRIDEALAALHRTSLGQPIAEP